MLPEQLYDVFRELSDLTVGQLTECLENLDAVIAAPATATSYGLIWPADLVRAVGPSGDGSRRSARRRSAP